MNDPDGVQVPIDVPLDDKGYIDNLAAICITAAAARCVRDNCNALDQRDLGKRIDPTGIHIFQVAIRRCY